MKKITINEKEYDIHCTAYTRFMYKKVFGTGIFKDLQKLSDLFAKQRLKRKELEGQSEDVIENAINQVTMDNMDDFLDSLLQVTYILILTANRNFVSFEKWLENLGAINLSDAWIEEVTETAVDSFLR